MDVINIRRSVRKYAAKPIEKDKIEQLVKAAMQAPSAKNQQPCSFVVVCNKETLQEMSKASSNIEMLKDAACSIIVLIDSSKLNMPLMAPQDAAAATQNILLKAVDLKLGSCWCGIYPREERMKLISKLLNIPKHFLVFSVISIGYPEDSKANYFIDRYDQNKVYYEKFK